jgi:hypothetical protein
MREMAERVYFRLCRTLGRLLRSATYSTTLVVHEHGQRWVQKNRAPFAPLLVSLGVPLARILSTGVRVLAQRAWEDREREMYACLHSASIRIGTHGTLVLPCFAGETLAALLENPKLGSLVRMRAIRLAVVALGEFHHRGFTHGDAMAENVLVDLESGVARWFDFETVHDSNRSLVWRRADDLRALLVTCLARTGPEKLADVLGLILDAYADDDVTTVLAASFATALQRPLAFHLGQAALSREYFQEIGRLVRERGAQRIP